MWTDCFIFLFTQLWTVSYFYLDFTLVADSSWFSAMDFTLFPPVCFTIVSSFNGLFQQVPLHLPPALMQWVIMQFS